MPRPGRPGHLHRLRQVVLLAVVAVTAAACQVRVGTDVSIAADGSGRVAVTVALDEELATSLATDGFDPFEGLEELPDGWRAERSEPGGGRAVTVTADFEDPEGLATRVAQLQEGLDDEDPLLLDDVALAVAEDGSATLEGRAGLHPPSSTGMRGVGVRFDGDDLGTLLAERGEKVLRVDLRVSMPGPVVDGNADEVDGNTATWTLPVTQLADVRAVSDPASDRTPWIVGAALLVGLGIGFVGLGLVRRRR